LSVRFFSFFFCFFQGAVRGVSHEHFFYFPFFRTSLCIPGYGAQSAAAASCLRLCGRGRDLAGADGGGCSAGVRRWQCRRFALPAGPGRPRGPGQLARCGAGAARAGAAPSPREQQERREPASPRARGGSPREHSAGQRREPAEAVGAAGARQTLSAASRVCPLPDCDASFRVSRVRGVVVFVCVCSPVQT